MDRDVEVGISDVINSVKLFVPACALESLNKKCAFQQGSTG